MIQLNAIKVCHGIITPIPVLNIHNPETRTSVSPSPPLPPPPKPYLANGNNRFLIDGDTTRDEFLKTIGRHNADHIRRLELSCQWFGKVEVTHIYPSLLLALLNRRCFVFNLVPPTPLVDCASQCCQSTHVSAIGHIWML